MEYRTLGRTGLQVGGISLGTEYLIEPPRETVVAVVREAVERGVNYLDALFAYPHYRDNLGAAIAGLRDRIILAGHLGAAETDGQYRRSREPKECETLIHDLLRRLKVDAVDVLFVSNCDDEEDYRRIMAPDGLLEMARRMQRDGKARFIAFSGHRVPASRMAVESGAFDILMHNVNLKAHHTEGRRELYRACAAHDVGLIAMKPFAGGALLQENAEPRATPAQCLSYALAQPGVSTALPGVKDTDELNQALATLDAPQEERDYSAALASIEEDVEGECCYCNHCLPCPVNVDVGKTLRLFSSAEGGVTESLKAEYAALPAKASECIACGTCAERCPFGVDVVARLEQAAQRFEGASASGAP